jgi:transposase-like protein
MNKRRTFSSAFKAQVVMEALSERETLSELSKKYELHPNMIAEWKKHFVSHAQDVFSSRGTSEEPASDLARKNEELFAKIGQLQVEVDFLKKVSAKLGILTNGVR